MSGDAWDRPIEALVPDIRSGRLSPVELAEAMLDRIARLDEALGSFVQVSSKALEAAHIAEREIRTSGWRGPLHGIPIAVKDLYLTRDMPTRAGTVAPGIDFPLKDSAAVARLRAAGAVLLGKTRTHEFAWGIVTPPARNPWDLDRVPGGSSGGTAAALAAGLCAGGLGSDTGGSIRIPASLCGVVGLKPTFGRVSRVGVVPHSWSLDHAGPLARTVSDAAILLSVLAGHDPSDPGSQERPVPDYTAALGQPVRGLRLGVCRNHFFECNQPEVETAVEGAIDYLASEGASVREFELPNLRHGLGAILAIELASSSAYHDASLRAGRVAAYADDVRTLVEIGRFVTAPDYLKAEQLRRVLMEDFRRAFEEVDAVVVPATPLTAWRVGETAVDIAGRSEGVLSAAWRLTYPFNLTGLPAISLPCGFDRQGLPIGLQVAAKPFDEGTAIRVAHAYERGHDWVRRRPPLATAHS